MDDEDELLRDEAIDNAEMSEERIGLRFFGIILLLLAACTIWGCATRPVCWSANSNRPCAIV